MQPKQIALLALVGLNFVIAVVAIVLAATSAASVKEVKAATSSSASNSMQAGEEGGSTETGLTGWYRYCVSGANFNKNCDPLYACTSVYGGVVLNFTAGNICTRMLYHSNGCPLTNVTLYGPRNESTISWTLEQQIPKVADFTVGAANQNLDGWLVACADVSTAVMTDAVQRPWRFMFDVTFGGVDYCMYNKTINDVLTNRFSIALTSRC